MSDDKKTAVTVYTWADKAEAAKKYMLLGNMRLVSELTGVPYNTLHDWRKQEWWGTLLEEIKAAQKAKRNNKLNEVIDESIELISDRIRNGDWVLNNKTGEVQRRPVSLRDIGNLTNQLITRQVQMEEINSRMDHQKETVQETLKALATEFAKWQRISNKKSATDVEVINLDMSEQGERSAIHDERPTGLQEGSGEVHIETGS